MTSTGRASDRPPRLLTIAGSDSGGGAGIQADLKTFAAHGAYGMSVITAVTAQNTHGVRAIHPIPGEVVAAQIDAVFEDLGVDAVKIGMLASAEIVTLVAEKLRQHASELPVVVDPVMVAESGDPLIADEAVSAIEELLFPLAALVTPNLPEAERLLGRPIETLEAREEAVLELGTHTAAALLKGGHAAGETVVDLLSDGTSLDRFEGPRIETTAGHGTGCTLAAAIACRLARGIDRVIAVGEAVEYLRGALAAAYPLGTGKGPVDHLYRGVRG